MKSALREVLETALLAALVFLILQTSVQNFRVEGSSMDPTLASGEHLLVNKAVYMRINVEPLSRVFPSLRNREGFRVYPFHPPRQGDIVVFRFPLDPSRDFVKRVMAGPGDTVEIRQGTVIVNGKPLSEPYVRHPSPWTALPRRLGENEYYVLGDNRGASNDSRDWGPVPLNNIIGKAWVIYWPFDRLDAFLASSWLR